MSGICVVYVTRDIKAWADSRNDFELNWLRQGDGNDEAKYHGKCGKLEG